MARFALRTFELTLYLDFYAFVGNLETREMYRACMKCAEKLFRIFRLKLSERCAKSLINETFCFGRYGLQRYENYMHENYMKYNCRVTAILIFVIDRRIESLYTALCDILCVQVFRSLFTL